MGRCPRFSGHQELMTQFLASKVTQKGFARLLLELLTKSA
jgi:hypothetical protein